MKNHTLNRLLIIALIFLSLPVFQGCEKIQIGEPGTCSVGTKYLLGSNVVFTIDSISDYRCPKDVVCIWGGDVDLYFNIKINFSETDTVVMLYRNNPVEIGNYTWNVLEVDPLRNAGQTIDQEDYRVKLLILKN